MSRGNDNAFPPALPREQLFELTNGYGIDIGLTKREYIATQIAAGIATNYDQAAENSAWTFEATAQRAVRIADALLAELAKEPS